MRICSFLPGATEIVFALGLGDQIVGVTHECDYPPAAKSKPVIVRSTIETNRATSLEIDRQVGEAVANAGLYTVDGEALGRAAPDLILTQALCDVCALDYNEVFRAAQALPQRPEILSLNPHSLDEVMGDIASVGKATGRKREAEALVSLLRNRVVDITRRAAQAAFRPRVGCIEWFEPLYAAGHWVPEMVALAGGRDILGIVRERSAKFVWTELLEREPEVLILMACGFDLRRTCSEAARLTRLPGWNEIPAVRLGHVFAVDGNSFFSRPGPRLIDGLKLLAQMIHPELFSWRAPADRVAQIPMSHRNVHEGQ
jgi:iron complex transport system substrate-binding protein